MLLERYNKKSITRGQVLAEVSDLSIYEHYLNDRVKPGVAVSTPWRDDRTPSFTFFIANSGDLLWKDQALGESGDCFKFVARMQHTTYAEAIRLVYKDMVLGRANPIWTRPVKPRPILIPSSYKYEIIGKDWSDKTLNYWKQYGISKETLDTYDVYPVYSYSVNGNYGGMSTDDNPIFVYVLGDEKYKIYRPLTKDKAEKWRTNCSLPQGYRQLPEDGELLIITKSLKDVMVLRELGYHAVATPSESTFFKDDLFDELAKRFKKIILFFDNDLPGITTAQKFSQQFNIPFVMINSYASKDLSDLYHDHGKQAAIDFCKTQLK